MIRVFKFGGASIKDAESIKRFVSILRQTNFENTIVVVSAIGKTTNALELILDKYLNNENELSITIQKVRETHIKILNELFDNKNHNVYAEISIYFEQISDFIKKNKSPNYNFIYDQIISYGELISTKILSEYLISQKIVNKLLDIRRVIKTNSKYRNAEVNWSKTKENLSKIDFSKYLSITQGFIASDENNFTTTMGRESSDYTAAIIAYSIDANSVTIWKDVDGVMSADPKKFNKSTLLKNLSYDEAIELAFYGATIIHPKTIQPLQKKEIPLYIKSFKKPENSGTKVANGVNIAPKIPCYILKENQILISISSLDFNFMINKNINEIFDMFLLKKIKINLTQNSAISFTLCVEDEYKNLDSLVSNLKFKYKVEVHKNLKLYTIRHFNNSSITNFLNGKNIHIKQEFKETLQVLST